MENKITAMGYLMRAIVFIALLCGMFWCPFLAAKYGYSDSGIIYAVISIVSWLYGCYMNLRCGYTIRPIKPFGMKILFDTWDDDEPA